MDDNMEKLFTRFFQAEDIHIRKHQGTGLGLSITKSIVEAHGGIIWAESGGKGQGTKFTFVLPICSAD